ncbi:IMPACT family protein [Fangia hongkongensis]|uniref:IMPACT family protein n=1 Tax=Fangia hongkongensis TaxID=270495 RepID=UPI0003620990|nr:YigZ family protein [Fangia hongkongensis]MBK2124584.1 YigZ family protein [Fangia hongkongensis]
MYKTPLTKNIYEILPIKRSRFIGEIYPVTQVQEVDAILRQARKAYPHANHICWAYQLLDKNTLRSSDDGEPQGSAGKPILQQLQGKQLSNTLILVIRYFGGTKLGVGGLIRAYAQTAKALIAHSELVDLKITTELIISFDYAQTSKVDTALYQLKLIPTLQNYDTKVTLHFKVDQNILSDIINALDGLIQNQIISVKTLGI